MRMLFLRIFPEIVTSTLWALSSLHPKHRARERFEGLALDLDLLFLDRQIPCMDSLRAPVSYERHPRLTSLVFV
jgi:hypothetical protein